MFVSPHPGWQWPPKRYCIDCLVRGSRTYQEIPLVFGWGGDINSWAVVAERVMVFGCHLYVFFGLSGFN